MNAVDLMALDDRRLSLLGEAIASLLDARRKLAALDLDQPARPKPPATKLNGAKPNGAHPPGSPYAKADLGPALEAFAKGPLATNALAQALGLSRSGAQRRIARMIEENLIVRRRGGDYRLVRPDEQPAANPPSLPAS